MTSIAKIILRKYKRNVNLKELNTFNLDCEAENTIKVVDEEMLPKIDKINHENTFVLGGGSNIILPSKLNKTVLLNRIEGIKIISEKANSVEVKVGAGVNWHELVTWAVENNYGGLENLALIPGSVGASPVQNIGAYGVEVKDVIKLVRFYNLEKKEFKEFTKDECYFGYRDSIFKNSLKEKTIITSVVFELSKVHNLNTEYNAFDQNSEKLINIRSVFDEVVRIRSSKLPDPKDLPNCGSFFKNPIISEIEFVELFQEYPEIPYFEVGDKYKIPAAWLIDEAGFRGQEIGGVKSYEKQPLVLVNTGNASGQSVIDYSNKIINKIRDKFGIELEREVNILT